MSRDKNYRENGGLVGVQLEKGKIAPAILLEPPSLPKKHEDLFRSCIRMCRWLALNAEHGVMVTEINILYRYALELGLMQTISPEESSN